MPGWNGRNRHRSQGDNTMPHGEPQRPKATNGKDPLDQLRGKAHNLGRKLHKGNWDDKRGVIIADMFSKSSINDLEESELENLIAELADALNRSLAG